MLQLSASGTPYEIGRQHGSGAKALVHGSLAFYEAKFRSAAKLEWPQVQELARQFEAPIREKWPRYLEEMQGVADGAERPLADILALNVRTEITFGTFSDGCTALGWSTGDGASYLAQNWDWDIPQKANLLVLEITQASLPTIKMVTEAGIIGKIGMNSSGVGVLLNAIRAKGMDPTRIPVHLALRLALDSSSRADAVAALEKHGVASSGHITIGDASGSVGLECSAFDVVQLPADKAGRALHSNHFLAEHVGVVESWPILMEDSNFRIGRLRQLLDNMGDKPSFEEMQGIFRDGKNYPASICRGPEDKAAATLFNIVMDLKSRKAEVLLGLPTKPDERVLLAF